jgi:hypothetical protein
MAVLGGGFSTERTMRLPTLESYLELVWASIVAIILSTLAGGAIGYVAQRQVSPSYRASAAVELPDVPTWVDVDPADPISDRTTIDTTSQLVFTPPVFRAVGDVTGLPTVRVSDHLSVSAYPLSRVLIITFEGSSVDQASAGAQAAGEALIVARSTTLAGTELRKAIELSNALNVIYNDTEHEFSERARSIKAQLRQIQDVRQGSDGSGGQVVDITVPRRVDKHPELQVVTGLVLGLLAGIIYAWWRPRSGGGNKRLIGAPEAAAQPARQIGRRLLPLGARLRLGRLSFRVRGRAASRPRR